MDDVAAVRQGTVKWFDFKKRYGFVVLTDDRGAGEEAMLHVSAFRGDKPRNVPKGAAVEVETERTKKGLAVKRVVSIQLPETFVDDDRYVLATVKWFDESRGYGFVTRGEGTDDVFLHAATLKSSSMTSIQAEAKLLVVIEPGKDGKPKVVHVKAAPA